MKKLITKYNKKASDLKIKGKLLIVGTKDLKTSDSWRELGFKISSFLISNKIKNIHITKVNSKSKEFLEGLYLGTYQFNLQKKFKPFNLKMSFDNKSKSFQKVQKIAFSKISSQSITKDFVNCPPNIATSEMILNSVLNLFDLVEVTPYLEDSLSAFGMNGHLAVNSGSKNPAMTIKLSYTPTHYKKHNVYVGKGLTYDSGGLSIKPTNSMINMQCDKSGAMVLLGFMDYIEKHGSENKITCYLSIAENMISSKSFRPGDILEMMNGKTVNIKNTDAEGRLVLFDNLCLAQYENKDIDSLTSIATLTGSAVVQFGTEASALVSFNDKLKDKVIKAGDKAGELFMNAAFHKYMLDGVKDSVADLSNTGTPYMGCQKAGLFLSKAVKKKNINKFVHWDIAGPSWIDKPFGTNTVGGTGFGVRTLIEMN